MAEHRRELLTVKVLSPDLPLPVRTHHRLAVCFCGRPLERVRWEQLEKDKAPEPVLVRRCPVCGWQSPWLRAAERTIADSDSLMRQIEESIEEARPVSVGERERLRQAAHGR